MTTRGKVSSQKNRNKVYINEVYINEMKKTKYWSSFKVLDSIKLK